MQELHRDAAGNWHGRTYIMSRRMKKGLKKVFWAFLTTPLILVTEVRSSSILL